MKGSHLFMDNGSIRLRAVKTRSTSPKYICSSERMKLIGTTDARFPEFGHHQEREMGGLWLHPIKLLDGFWLRLRDKSADNVNTWLIADGFAVDPAGVTFTYDNNLGHTSVKVTQRQICPDEAAGLIVEYRLRNQGMNPAPVELEWLGRTDLQPVWFSETAGIQSGGQDEGKWLDDKRLFLIKDPANPWYAAVGSSPAPDSQEIHHSFGPEITGGDGVSLSMCYTFTLLPDECRSVRFFVAGSHESREDCLGQYETLLSLQDPERFKEERYQRLLARSHVEVPDSHFQEIYNWIKVHTDWLTMDTAGYGRGLAAGLPEYPWWFGCDNCYALQGVLAMGDFELVRDTLALLLRYSEMHNGNGRILHEVTTGGICANPGNTQETAHFIVMLWLYYEWTGDFTLIEQAFPYLQKSVQWLKEQDPEGELFPGGYGIIEIAGLNSKMIDTAVYTAEAYRCYGLICACMERTEEAAAYRELGDRVRRALNTQMWDEREGLYCDAFTSVPEVLKKKAAILEKRHGKNAELAEDILNRAIKVKSQESRGKSGWLLNYNWVINTPMEMGIAPKDKAARALRELHTSKFIGPDGMYLSGVYRDAQMTISTGVMAAAQARYGYADRALDLLRRLFGTFGRISPGCLAEMSPDYGCFVQGWTAYAAAVPVVRYFFGLQPQANPGTENRLVLWPCMPKDWPEATLKNAPVLDGELSLHFERENGKSVYRGDFTGCAPVLFAVQAGENVEIDGKRYDAEQNECLVPLRAANFTVTVLS